MQTCDSWTPFLFQMPKRKNKLRNGAGGKVTEAMLVEACNRGDLGQLRNWGQQGVRVRTHRPLFTAVENIYFDLDLVRCLVNDLGADANQDDDYGQSAVHVACDRGRLAMVICLVNEFGVDVNDGDILDGATPLHLAAKEGYIDIVRCLLDELSANVDQQDRWGATALFDVAHEGYLDIMQCLVRTKGKECIQPNGGGHLASGGRFCRADRVPGGQDQLLSSWMQRRGDQEVPGLHAGAVLRAGLSCGALAGAQGRVPAAGRRAQECTGGWRQVRALDF
jgi:hypothetical protein